MSLRTPLLALIILASATGLADAQTRVKDSVVIQNKTTIPITYELQCDGGAWQKFVLLPGERLAHHSDVLPGDLPPRVQVRYMDLIPHNVMNYNDVFTGVVVDPLAGPAYSFVVSGGRLYLVR